MMPDIITYRSDDAPESERWIAFFRTKKRLPMVFDGRTKEIVTATAEAWWKEEIAKEAKRKELIARMAERHRAS